MIDLQLRQLPDSCRPLLGKFYRAHRSHMRVPAGARCWVLWDREIVAGLCLRDLDEGHWLTGLLVAPGRRRQRLAQQLVTQVARTCERPIWLFCEPALGPFYQRLGFTECQALPPALAARLENYNRHKTLVAFCNLPGTCSCPNDT